jgi:hypothetical protein
VFHQIPETHPFFIHIIMANVDSNITSKQQKLVEYATTLPSAPVGVWLLSVDMLEEE